MQKTEEREAVTIINEGQKIFGVIHRPIGQVNVPAIVICSGFAGNKCGKFRLFVRLAQELSKLGIAVLRFDYRGAGDSEGDFKDVTIEGKISDTLACLKFLEKDPQVDSNRIGLLGRSLGGMISILAAYRYEKIKSLVLWAPVFTNKPWKDLWEAIQHQQLTANQNKAINSLPFPIPNREFIQQFFQLNLEDHLNELRHVPILHLEAEKDNVVNLDHGKGYRLIREHAAQSRFIRLPNSDHDFSDVADQKLAIEETCRWYQEIFSL